MSFLTFQAAKDLGGGGSFLGSLFGFGSSVEKEEDLQPYQQLLKLLKSVKLRFQAGELELGKIDLNFILDLLREESELWHKSFHHEASISDGIEVPCLGR